MELRASIIGSLAVMAAAAFAAVPASASAAGRQGDTRDFRGANWADPRDNYASDEVVPSGLSTEDDYATTYRKATGIVSEFRRELKANTIRLPINPSSVGTRWWQSYRGAIDASLDQGDKVILSYWEANDAKDGRVDDPAAFDAMWDTVVKAYRKNPHVYFEPMNEPFGYSLDEWVSLTSVLARPAQRRPARPGRHLRHRLQRPRHRGRRGARARRHAAVAALLRLLGQRHDRGGLEGEPGAAHRRIRLAHDHRRSRRADDHRPQLRQPRGQRLHLLLRRPHRHGPRAEHGYRLLAGPAHRRRVLDDDAGQAKATSRSTAPAGSRSCNGAGACSSASRSTTCRLRPPARCCAEWPAAAASTCPASRRTTAPRWTCGTATAEATSRGTGPPTSSSPSTATSA